jgi:hypothetical protein
MMSPADGTAASATATASRLLREATALQHLAVERLPTMRALLGAVLSVDDYIQVLHRHHAVLAGWERRESDWLHASGDAAWRYGQRARRCWNRIWPRCGRRRRCRRRHRRQSQPAVAGACCTWLKARAWAGG